MIQLLGVLKTLIKPSSCVTDNYIYRLHYKATVVILIGCSLLVTARQYIGDPIDCFKVGDIKEEIVDNFCWIHTTFSIETAWKKEVGTEVIYPGIENSQAKGNGDKRVYHAYYQWVCFVLFYQAIFFYIPRYIWKNVEGGRIKYLILGLDQPIISEDQKNNNRALLVEYLYTNINNHNTLFRIHVLTEGLNFLNVILQMILMDRFLGGEFSTFGWEVLKFSEWDGSLRYDPMIRVFPRLTKCIFHDFGPSGDVRKHDTLCILPINIINEKIYIFLWFWFYFLAIVSFIALVYRVITIMVPKVRYLATQSHCHSNDNALRLVCSQCGIGDWFVLDLLSKNLDPFNFKDLIQELYHRFELKGVNGK